MPIKSSKQFRLMEAAAHGHVKGMSGLSKEDAKKMLDKTPKKNKGMFAKGKD